MRRIDLSSLRRTAIAAVLASVAMTGCDSAPQAGLAMPARVTAIASASHEGKVTVRVGLDSTAQRVYAVGPQETTLGLASLADALAEARKLTVHPDTVYLYTEPGARGFDVLMALKAARAAGFKETVAWADYSFADPAKSEPKRWTQSLSQIDGFARTATDSGRVTR